MKRLILLIIPVVLVAIAACETRFDGPNGIDTVAVQIAEGPLGSADDPVPFPEQPLLYRLQVRALDESGRVDESYDGKVAFRVEPVGRLAPGQASRVQIENGSADDIEIWVESCHGDVAIWVEDAGGVDTSGTYAVGASPVLHFAHPTMAQVQRTDDFESSGLRGDFVDVRVTDRRVVVTNVRRDGFYCQDIDEPDGAYAGMYVYTHNQPTGVNAGDRLAALRGEVDEFFGFTELGFPDYLLDDQQGIDVQPALIDANMLTDNDVMEALESSLIQVPGATRFPVDDQFDLYDQWPITLDPGGDCSAEAAGMLVAETAVFEGFDPRTMTGQQLERVVGTLRYHYLAEPPWMIIPRNRGDLE